MGLPIQRASIGGGGNSPIECPHCHRQVTVGPDNLCPECHQDVTVPPASPATMPTPGSNTNPLIIIGGVAALLLVIVLAVALALGWRPFGGSSQSSADQTATVQSADPSPTIDVSRIASVTPAAPQATAQASAPTAQPSPTINVATVPSVTPARPALPTAATNGPALGQASTPRDRVLLVQSGLLNDEQIQPFRAAGFQVMQYGTGDALALYDAINSVGQKVEVILVSNGVDTASNSTLSQTVEKFVQADNWLVAIAIQTSPTHNVDAVEAFSDRVPGKAVIIITPEELQSTLEAEIGKYTQ